MNLKRDSHTDKVNTGLPNSFISVVLKLPNGSVDTLPECDFGVIGRREVFGDESRSLVIRDFLD